MKSFELRNPVKLYFGPGTVEKAGDATARLGKRALVVTGVHSARKTGLLERIRNLLERSGVESILFEKATPNPISTTVDEGVALFKNRSCDVIVGVGGGSAIDTAKAISLCVANGGQIVDYQPGGSCTSANPSMAVPVVAIVTTAGTGTEINRYLVITNAENHEKPGIGFDCTYPAVGIVDPDLMTSMPPDVTTDTGLDALYHALEAYISVNATPFSDLLATKAIDLVVSSLEKAIANGRDLNARTNMALASTLAGWAIDLAGTVALHGAAHPVSGRLNATHGQSLAALAVAYLRNNHQAAPERFATLARLLGVGGKGLSTDELAAGSADALRDFQRQVGRDITLSSLGVRQEMIPELVRDTFRTMSGAVSNNPRPLTEMDIELLYKESL